MASSKLLLYDHPASAFAQKIRIALRHQNITFSRSEPQGLGSGHAIPDLAAANPRLEVPTLVVDDDLKLFDSKVILEYLEDAYPDAPTLLPQSAGARAKARLVQEICDSQWDGVNWGVGEVVGCDRAVGELREEILARARRETEGIFEWLEGYLAEKPFFGGEEFGFADVCVAAQMGWSVVHGLGPGDDTPLYGWLVRVREIPAVKETWAEMEEALRVMGPLFKDAFKPGSGARREYRDHRLEFLVRAGGLGIVEEGIREGTVRFSWPGRL